ETIMGILLTESEAGKASVIGDIFLKPFTRSYGAMQVRLPTAKLVIRSGYINFDKEDEYLLIKMITDTEFNIALGTAYFKNMLDRFEGKENQWMKSVIAYNSGPGNVKKFLNQGKTHYLKRVKKYIKLVRNLKKEGLIDY
ncbi:MAG: transglycosylase SLT domain-containing protein, partial [Bacteroidota bacterium]|nr:transglycosylase SLT domain-containing protein [Bacteroidota bacterium]